MNIRTYSELIKMDSFEDRFEYLKLGGRVGQDTFGFDRIFNQMFYHSIEWKSVRDEIISRDNGCDLGVKGYELYEKIIIHHMNPISLNDIKLASDYLLNPEYLICVSHQTHNAIHYGDSNQIFKGIVERHKNDMCPWRHD